NHVATPAAIPAVRSAELDELFAAERQAAVPAVTRANIDLGFVEEFHGERNMRARTSKREGPRSRPSTNSFQELRAQSPGGARMGHASLMRPARPLPTVWFVNGRYASARTVPRRSSRP